MKELSPGTLARLAGGLYLVNILAGAFAIGYVPATGNGQLIRAGLAAHVLVTATNVPLALIFYELFKVVDRRVALLDVLFTVVATAIEASGIASEVNAAKPFVVDAASYTVSTVFYGFDALALGYLVYRSTFVPRAIGVLLAVDGLVYLFNSFATLLAPDFAARLVPYILSPILAGEGSLTVWLLVMGINVARRERLAGSAIERVQ